MRTPFLVILAGMAAVVSARADLDRIDADGVTETGGSPAFARMLPRTRTDGRLSPSLLPPVSDWASQPISNLYYVSGNATEAGNGSPQYPFNTLAEALSRGAPQSAYLLTPATYSAAFTLPSSRAVALCGFGPLTYVSSLTVTASGTSADTALTLCGLHVGTLTVHGGKVDVRLLGASVSTLAGTASDATVTRLDLGAVIGVSTLTHRDVYAGHDTIPVANVLKTADKALQLELSAGRARVTASGGGTETVAYVSDVTTATNVLGQALVALAAEDTRLDGRIDSEALSRQAGDIAVSNRMETAVTDLSEQLTAIGTSWGEQVTALSTRIGSLSSSLQTLSDKETNDVRVLDGKITAVQTGYQTADATLNTNLRAAITSGIDGLRSEVPGIADERATLIANAQIQTATGVVLSVVAKVNQASVSRDTTLGSSLSTLSGSVGTLTGRVNGHDTSIYNLGVTDTGLASSIASLNSSVGTLSSDVSDLTSEVSGLTSWQGTMNSWKNNTLTPKINTIVTTINSIINCLNQIKAGHASEIVVPSPI